MESQRLALSVGMLLLLACGSPVLSAALPPWWPWPPGGGGDDPAAKAHGAWAETLEFLWNETRARVGFCVGNNPWKVAFLMQQSFPWPLPQGPMDDSMCQNRTVVEPFLCGPEEIETYYKVGRNAMAEGDGWLPCNRQLACLSRASRALLPALLSSPHPPTRLQFMLLTDDFEKVSARSLCEPNCRLVQIISPLCSLPSTTHVTHAGARHARLHGWCSRLTRLHARLLRR